MHRSPMVQADSLITGTCYWSASYAELGGDRRIEAAGRFLAALRELPAAQLFETLEAPPEHRRWRSVPPKSADHLGITVSPAPVPPPGDHIALVCGGAHAAAHNPPPGALTLINSAKTAAPAACPSVLRDAGLSGGTHFAELQITTSGSLSLRAATTREGLSWQARCRASFAAWQGRNDDDHRDPRGAV